MGLQSLEFQDRILTPHYSFPGVCGPQLLLTFESPLRTPRNSIEAEQYVLRISGHGRF
jgi:hypothetical protein